MILRRGEFFGELRQIHENMGCLWGEPTPITKMAQRLRNGRFPGCGGGRRQHTSTCIHAWVNPDDIDVTVKDDVLTIKATSSTERAHKEGNYLIKGCRAGAFHRSLRLPDTINADLAAPHYEQGVLTATLPKVEAKKAKKLTVTSSNALEGEKSKLLPTPRKWERQALPLFYLTRTRGSTTTGVSGERCFE